MNYVCAYKRFFWYNGGHVAIVKIDLLNGTIESFKEITGFCDGKIRAIRGIRMHS